MKTLTIILQPIRLKGDPEDTETLQTDLYEKIQTMIESETLDFAIEDDEFGDEESD